MRFITYLILALIALALVIIGFANRAIVTLTLLPAEFVPFTKYNFSYELPLYMVVFGGIAAGILFGFFWEWMREHKHRSEATVNRRERALLAQELEKIKADRQKGKDEILALLDDGTARTS
ncbi:LapA family protein [Rhodobacteraceae bacterium SC52]|nr:LapA family protein [Rhodobacteraceae bacterium SC52]